MSKLRQYHYEFEWVHGIRSLITNITIRTPRSKKFVESIVSGVVVYDISTDTPLVRMITPIAVQHLSAIVEEIEVQRRFLNDLRN